jgi:CubicO group peptidase (beta-lactamase class C family)
MRGPKASDSDSALGLTPQVPWRVVEVQALPEFRLMVRFTDDTQGHIEMGGLIRSPDSGVFAPLGDPARFGQVYLERGVVTWPGGIDLAPDAMYDAIKASGCWVLA